MAEKKPVISLLKSNSDELVVLRARVQQQSELIAMLKRRADETLMQVTSLSGENASLLKERDAMSEELTEEIKRCKSVERHFEALSANHNQIIVIKDDYKRENEVLKRRLQEQSPGNGDNPEIIQQEADIQKLRSELKAVQVALASEQATVHARDREIKHLRIELQRSKETSQTLCASLEQKLEDANAKTKLLSNELNTKEQENRQAKKDISQVVAELQSKLSVERDDAKSKDDKLKEAEAEVVRLRKEIAEVNKHRRQKEEELSLSTVSVELAQVKKEYAAYKTHMTGQLEQERELNKKLRKLLNY